MIVRIFNEIQFFFACIFSFCSLFECILLPQMCELRLVVEYHTHSCSLSLYIQYNMKLFESENQQAEQLWHSYII